jgi:hypothetical protein
VASVGHEARDTANTARGHSELDQKPRHRVGTSNGKRRSERVILKVWDFWTLDPDFDDDDTDIIALRHEIETTGVVALHPNGNRRNGVDDPVPLHTHERDGLSELKRRQRTHAAEVEVKPIPVKYLPPVRRFELPFTLPDPTEEMLRNMRLYDPLEKGIGRVWRDFVMIHDDDIKNANVENHDIKWTEVWRGRGYIIFKRDLKGVMSW